MARRTSLALPHGLGHGWAAVLWDVTWDLVDKHGFNPNVYEAWDTGGNNRALQYVTDGLKFQGCGPGLVVARDAIIAAADLLSEGEDTCTLWASFARRGLFSAVQGTTARDDNSEAFDTHPDCREGFFGCVRPADPQYGQPRRGRRDGVRRRRRSRPRHPRQQLPVLTTGGLPNAAHGDPGGRAHHAATAADPAETPGNSRLSFDPSTGRYTFPWKTLQSWAGTCREFVLTRDDGIQHRAYFRFQANPASALSGRISDSDGQPVAQATVTLRGPIFCEDDEPTNGWYSFDDSARHL